LKAAAAAEMRLDMVEALQPQLHANFRYRPRFSTSCDLECPLYNRHCKTLSCSLQEEDHFRGLTKVTFYGTFSD